MSKLGDVLNGDSTTYNYKGIELQFSPLSGKHIGLVLEIDGKKDDPELTYKLIFASLEVNHPDITYDEVLRIPFTDVAAMAEIVVKVSGFENKTK